MKVIETNSLGFTLRKSVPETNEEYDNLAKRGPNAACDDAVASTLYRGTFPIFRDLFLHGDDEAGIKGIDAQTGIERKTKESGKKNEAGEPVLVYDETEGAYWKRVQAELKLTDEQAIAKFAEHAQACMDIAAFDPSVKERKSAGPGIAKTYTKIATDAVAQGKASALASLLGTKLGREIVLTGETETDVKVLARAIADNEARKREALKAEYAV